MNQSHALNAFQTYCHELFTCFSFATQGLNQIAEQFRSRLAGDSNQSLIIGTGHPDTGRPHSRISMASAVANSEKNGTFTDTLAKALIVSMYQAWDELYRHEMAREIGVEPKHIQSDLIGDMRNLRTWIVHKKSRIDSKCKGMTVLGWSLGEGEVLFVTQEMFAHLIDCINEIRVYVHDA